MVLAHTVSYVGHMRNSALSTACSASTHGMVARFPISLASRLGSSRTVPAAAFWPSLSTFPSP
ncbi:MAG: hypothetical protein Q8P67_00305 [archaeon]|nr:hypothetical protein [archaeon]